MATSPVARTTSLSSRPAPAMTPVLVDVTPRALVVETAGGWCDVIVPRNAKIPCERTRAFTTSSDLQTVVRIRVGQGEEAHFGQNTLLGEIELSSLRPAPRGEVTNQLRFEVDESGTLNVAATDIASGREARPTLQLVGIAGTASCQRRCWLARRRCGCNRSHPWKPTRTTSPEWMASLDELTYYDLFRLEPTATFDEVRAGFHVFCGMFHPDRHMERPQEDRCALSTIFQKARDRGVTSS